jgi:hypothetical protein
MSRVICKHLEENLLQFEGSDNRVYLYNVDTNETWVRVTDYQTIPKDFVEAFERAHCMLPGK